MNYTDAQYTMMARLETGFYWRCFSDPTVDEIMRFLDQERLAAPREDITHDLWVLTEKGKAVLNTRRIELAAEQKRLQERHEDHANEERRHRTQNKIAVIMPIVTFLLGLLAEHFLGIAGMIFTAISG